MNGRGAVRNFILNASTSYFPGPGKKPSTLAEPSGQRRAVGKLNPLGDAALGVYAPTPGPLMRVGEHRGEVPNMDTTRVADVAARLVFSAACAVAVPLSPP